MKTTTLATLTATSILMVVAMPAAAEHSRHDHHGDGYSHHGHYWHHGHWRPEWWWGVAGLWYLDPVYPFYVPYTPATVVVQPPSPAPSAATTGTGYWYYCDSAQGYYPYVRSCPTAWRPVPATPLR